MLVLWTLARPQDTSLWIFLPCCHRRHDPSSPFTIVDARGGGTETAVGQGALALRILAPDKRREGGAMRMMMTMGAFEKSPVNRGGSHVARRAGRS
jgi:hypothetical protein